MDNANSHQSVTKSTQNLPYLWTPILGCVPIKLVNTIVFVLIYFQFNFLSYILKRLKIINTHFEFFIYFENCR